LDSIAVGKPDIILLDVQMPDMTGLELAQHLQQNKDKGHHHTHIPAIIFITAYDNYALTAFEVHAMDYLLKPVRAGRLTEAIMRIAVVQAANQQRHQQIEQILPLPAVAAAAARQCFSVLERGRILLVPVRDILFIRAEQKYLTLQTHSARYLLEESLAAIEQEMASVMVRIHRNTLASRQAIIGVERTSVLSEVDDSDEKLQEMWQLILRGCDERLPISRRQWRIIKGLVRR
jgi:two-component system response regulator AlgR